MDKKQFERMEKDLEKAEGLAFNVGFKMWDHAFHGDDKTLMEDVKLIQEAVERINRVRGHLHIEAEFAGAE